MKLSTMLPPLHCRVPSDWENGTLITGREYYDDLGLCLTPPSTPHTNPLIILGTKLNCPLMDHDCTYMVLKPRNGCTFLNMKQLNKLFIISDEREPWVWAANYPRLTSLLDRSLNCLVPRMALGEGLATHPPVLAHREPLYCKAAPSLQKVNCTMAPLSCRGA